MALHWGKNIKIDATWIAYDDQLNTQRTQSMQASDLESKTQQTLRSLAGTNLGGLLIRLLNNQPQQLEIRPLTPTLISKTAASAVNPGKANAPSTSASVCAPYICDGAGSSVTLWYNPDAWIGTAPHKAIDPNANMRADDVLFHELIHVLRQMRGLGDRQSMGYGYTNLEEFYAILLTNIYVSDVGRQADLRGTHDLPFKPLAGKPGWSTADDGGFYTMFSTEIDQLCSRMPDLCTPVSWLGKGWNPLRRRTEMRMKS